MSTFEDRQKGFENKFAYDEEMTFKINARRNKLFGLWAAEKLGKTGDEAEVYAKDVVMAEFESDGDVVEKVLKDFEKSGISIGSKQLYAELEYLLPVAREQVMNS